MNWEIIRKDLKEKKVSLVIYCLAGAALVWLYISIYPSLAAQAKDLEKIMAALPKDVMKAFGAEGTGLENAESLLSGKHFGLIWPVLMIILMLSRTGNAIAGEIENGTIGTLLSQPVSRAKIYFSKYLSAVITLMIFIVSTVLINIPLLMAYRIDFSMKYELLFALMCFLFGLAVIGVSLAISAAVNERSRVYSTFGGVIVLMFIINIVSGLKESLSDLRYGSIFYYFNSNHMLVRHEINLVTVILLISSAIVGYVIGFKIFTNRDISA